MGLLTGALSMTSYYAKLEALGGAIPAANLDSYARTGTVPTAAYRLTRSDLEKASILVPDLAEIQAGDLVVHYGAGEGQYGNPMRIGIVIYAPTAGRPAPGADATAYLKSVVVLSAQEGERQVSLGTWLTDGTTKGFADDTRSYHLRRLLRKPGEVTVKAAARMMAPSARGIIAARGDGGSYQTTAKVVIDSCTFYAELRMVDKPYECSGKRGAEPWRWIPNTGEYLVLGRLRIMMWNRYDSPIDIGNEMANKQFSVTLGGLDRNFKNGDIYANINGNCGDGFEIACASAEGFFNTTATQPVIKLYDYDQNVEDGDPRSGVYVPTTIPWQGSLAVDRNGYIVWRNGADKMYFGIRPIVTDVCPGDDLLLTAKVTIKSQKTGYEVPNQALAKIAMEETDYLAVYDKKMLWRANLYIEETGKVDWNDEHPWNAPPGLGEIPIGGVPKWWSAEWGYNEWNRKSSDDSIYVDWNTARGLADLPAGDGKQVISLPSITPLAPLTEGVTDAGNVVTSVPYDLPRLFSVDDKTAYAGAEDSPFDYKLKMLYQKGLEAAMVNIDGKRFVKAKNLWPALPPGSMNDLDRFESLKDYMDNVQKLEGEDLTEAQAAMEGDSQGWKKAEAVKSFKMSCFAAVDSQAYDHRWWKYAYEESNMGNGATRSFVPSLRLLFGAVEGTTLFNRIEAVPDGEGTILVKRADMQDKEWLVGAGVDCLGFVQRARSYSRGRYQWPGLAAWWTEGAEGKGILDVLGLMKAAANRQYPKPDVFTVLFTFTNTPIGHDISEIIENHTNPIYKDEYASLCRVVPGDLVVFGNNEHIAMVASVTYGRLGELKDIGLIESSYGLHKGEEGLDYIQYVEKGRTLKDSYNKASEYKDYVIIRLKTRAGG